MNLGKRERELLAQLQNDAGPIQVTSPRMTRTETNSRIRAARLLAKKGLVRVDRAMSTTRTARRIVLWAHLTAFGSQFAEIYFVQLRTGGRIMSAKFLRETGRTLPIAEHQRRYPVWLVPFHVRSRNQETSGLPSQKETNNAL